MTARERVEMTARETVEIMVRTSRGSMTVWSPSEVRDALDALESAVAARTREQVAREASVLRVRSAASRRVHEAVATRFGLLLPACGTHYLRPGPPVPDGATVTCPMCNGDEQSIDWEQR